MSERGARRLAWSAFLVYMLILVASLVLDVGASRTTGKSAGSGADIVFIFITAAFPVTAVLILSRQPRNRIGWILMAIGLAWVIGPESLGDFLISRGDLAGGAVAIAISAPSWVPPLLLMGTSLLLRFPDGQLLSPRWKKVEWVALAAMVVVMLGITFSPGDLADSGYPNLRNPLGIRALKPLLDAALVFIFLIPATTIASAVSLVKRFRRSAGTERLQLKWLAFAAAAVAGVYLLAISVSLPYAWIGPGTPPWVAFIQTVSFISFVFIPIAIGFAVLKYRLYDIDVVINKALVYGAMAAFITAVYVAIVVGIGHAVGSDRNIGLSILATALVAVGFQPIRERVQRLANRLVYGKRATPYEVLSEFSGGMSHTVATEDLLPGMARTVAEAVGAARADVWLRVGSELVREASWPQPDGGAKSTAAVEGDPNEVAVPDGDAAVPVRHQGELLGVIGVRKSAGEAVTPADTKLLEDLASQAGLVLRNVRLIEELRTSRQRLVTAQDQERRRLERDLHDGAQQRLVAISLALRLARALIEPEKDAPLAERLDQASEELGRALAELREFARGIHPAILTERGVVPALRSLAERSTVPTTVDVEVNGERFPAAVEATVYFVASEALANVGKYARATAVGIRVSAGDGHLTLEVADNGIGGADPSRGSGLRGLSDRVAAVDGTLELDSAPGEGTRLMVRIPVPVLAGAMP
jgi:signal transduction histidine kinase